MKNPKAGFALIDFLFGVSLILIALGTVALASHLVPKKGPEKARKIKTVQTNGPSKTETPTSLTEVAQKPTSESIKAADEQRPLPTEGKDYHHRELTEAEVPTTQKHGDSRQSTGAKAPRTEEISDSKRPSTSSQGNFWELDYLEQPDQTSCQINPYLANCASYLYDLYPDPYSPEYQQQHYAWYSQQDPAQLFFTDPGQLYMQDPVQYSMMESIFNYNPIPGLPTIPGF